MRKRVRSLQSEGSNNLVRLRVAIEKLNVRRTAAVGLDHALSRHGGFVIPYARTKSVILRTIRRVGREKEVWVLESALTRLNSVTRIGDECGWVLIVAPKECVLAPFRKIHVHTPFPFPERLGYGCSSVGSRLFVE